MTNRPTQGLYQLVITLRNGEKHRLNFVNREDAREAHFKAEEAGYTTDYYTCRAYALTRTKDIDQAFEDLARFDR